MFGESLLSADGSLTNISKCLASRCSPLTDRSPISVRIRTKRIFFLWSVTSSDSVLSTQCHDVLSLVVIIADTGVEEETIHVSAGKDFAMVRTATGKVSAIKAAIGTVI